MVKDDLNTYKPVVERLGLDHQICITHVKKLAPLCRRGRRDVPGTNSVTERATGRSEIRRKTVSGYKSEDWMLNGFELTQRAWSGRYGLEDMSELTAAPRRSQGGIARPPKPAPKCPTVSGTVKCCFAVFSYLEYNKHGLIRLVARGEMLDERSERRRKRLTAMSDAAPGIEAEAVSDAVYFMASSLVRSAVESAVEAEAEILADAVAKAVAEVLPKIVDVEVEVDYDAYQWPNIDLGDGLAQYEVKIIPEDVAEDLEDRAYEYVLLGIAEELIKSEGENA